MLLLLAVGAVLVYLALKLVQFYGADADLSVLGSKMKPQYFEGKVVWVTGASSGSKPISIWILLQQINEATPM
jgi:chemotaxis methyl-accepting protein methylase